MNQISGVLTQALEILKERTGIKISWQSYGKSDDKVYGIVFQDRNMQFVVEYRNKLAAYQVDEIVKTKDFRFSLLVVAEQIAGAAREQLRSKGIAYLERNGNIYINTSHALIFLDGNKPVNETRPVTNRAFTKTGLKAVFHLLNDPDAISRTYRDLARETGIALGNIKYIMDGLVEAGYIIPLKKRKIALKNKKDLLERWISGYRETLKPQLQLGAFRLADEKRNNWQDISLKETGMLWGGEAAGEILTGYLQARTLTLYTPELTATQVNAIGLVPDNNGDIHVCNKFWNGQDSVPALLVYADLLTTDEPWCIKTANIIYEKYVKEKIEAGDI